MSASNADIFVKNFIDRRSEIEERLKNAATNEKLIEIILEMAEDLGFPTGNFDGDDIKQAAVNRAVLSPDIYNPPTFEKMVELFKQGVRPEDLW